MLNANFRWRNGIGSGVPQAQIRNRSADHNNQ